MVFVAAVASGADLPAQVDATRYECATLEDMVRSAGRLSISAVHVNPHGGGGVSTNTFVSGPAHCTFIDEWPSQWKIRAKDGEVCTRLYICLPRDMYDGPLWRRW
jgi:hypothetical protein